MDNKKNNMKQAMYEMFGVGADQNEKEAENGTEEVRVSKAAAPAKTAVREAPAAPVPRSGAAASYLAPGTVFEGNLRSAGDIEIAGDFKGDIKTEGTVVLHSNVQGNVTAKSLKLSGCSMVGDITAQDLVVINQGSCITGNVSAREVQVAGQVTGDLKVSETAVLEGSAQVNGNIITSSIEVVRGAVICGGIEIKPTAAAKPGKA